MRSKKSLPVTNIDGIIRQPQPKRPKRFKLNGRLLAAVVIVVIAVGGFAVYASHRDKSQNDDVTTLTAAVNRHYLLPTDEQPALATVTDKDKVSNAFRGKAENGDRILIYQKNAQAIVYRESIDRVVAVVPVAIDTPQTGQQPQ